MKHLTVAATALATVAGAVLLAACGGGGASKSGGGDTVTREAFITRADAICADANEKRESLQDPGLFSRPYDYPKIARYAERLGAAYTSALEKLRALEVPQADSRKAKLIFLTFGLAFGQIDDFIDTARAGVPGEGPYFKWAETASRAQTLAADYGFEACAAFGMP